jgi:hypothetical protein
VTDAVETIGQDVDEEAADELVTSHGPWMDEAKGRFNGAPENERRGLHR